MAAATQPQPTTLDPDLDAYPKAYEIVDGLPVGREVADPAADAYEEAYEIVDGQPTEWPEMGEFSVEVASILILPLGTYVRQHGLGRAIVEPRFRLKGKQQRRPDLAFISFAQWPKGRRAPRQAAWPLIPDLAVEVISENDEAFKVIAKVKEYFDAGVRAVWVIYPNVEVVHVYHAFDRIEVVTKDGTLDGGVVVPGFRLPLAELFEGEDAPEPTATESAPEPID